MKHIDGIFHGRRGSERTSSIWDFRFFSPPSGDTKKHTVKFYRNMYENHLVMKPKNHGETPEQRLQFLPCLYHPLVPHQWPTARPWGLLKRERQEWKNGNKGPNKGDKEWSWMSGWSIDKQIGSEFIIQWLIIHGRYLSNDLCSKTGYEPPLGHKLGLITNKAIQ